MQNFTSPTKSMHKIFSRGQKLCAFYQKCGAFWVKKIVRFFVLFLAKVGAPLSSKLLKTLSVGVAMVVSFLYVDNF